MGLLLLLLAGCGFQLADLEDGEWYPGGDTTNRLLLGSNAFLMPAQNLTTENELDFYSGNGFFNQGWVQAPASTTARDGLGPLFNARSCSGCHFRDGKGFLPETGEAPFVGLLLRLSVAGEDGPVPHPVYGEQLQDQANPDVPIEALPSVQWSPIEGQYEDGTAYTLMQPEYTLSDFAHGPMDEDVMLSPRIAPHMVGLGLLEAIPVDRLEELSDPDDLDGDGISGRLQWEETEDGRLPGRFGWKGDAPTVELQVGRAFAGDLGLTSRVVTMDDCTDSQEVCVTQPSGGEPEVDDNLFDLVTLYSRTLAVPVRRMADDKTVLKGKKIFHDIRCSACHVPSHVTGEAALEELEGQLIWPYTDLLLHDMGEGLADGRPVGEASGSEWKTPPLWSLGLVDDVGGQASFLHDGRARSIEEAILWHGGEAAESQEMFTALSVDERNALLTFLDDL